MEDQLHLFVPATRKTGPGTSRPAENSITNTGRRSTHAVLILGVLKQHDGSTVSELCQHLPLTEMQTNKRMNDLVENGLITRGSARAFCVKGSKCSTWWVIEK